MTKNNVYKRCSGFSSKTQDNMHILLFDFDVDNCFLSKIEFELTRLQKKFNLSDFYILKTKHGFNAICLDKFDIFSVNIIKDNCRMSDKKHDLIGFNKGSWVIELNDNKKLISHILNNGIYKKSNSHRLIIEKWFNTKIIKDKDFDDFDIIILEYYLRRDIND